MRGDAMKKDVFEVDQEGMIIEYLLMNDEEIEQARKNGRLIIEQGWNQTFFEPKWDFVKEEWVEGLTDEEVQQREDEIIKQENQPSKIERLETALMELAILTMNGGNGGE